jgi:hypothetical protein
MGYVPHRSLGRMRAWRRASAWVILSKASHCGWRSERYSRGRESLCVCVYSADDLPVPDSQLPPIINGHQALISTLPRSTLQRAVRMLEPLCELRRDVEDGRRKLSAVGHQLAHD